MLRAFFATLLVIVSSSVMLVSTASFAAGSDDARGFVDGLASQALAIVKDNTASKPDKQAKLETLFGDSVDIDWVSRFVLGKYWRQATEPQKMLYKERYKAFLIKHYTSKFSDYTNESYRINKVIDQGGGEYQLTMEILRGRNPSVIVDYRVRSMPEGGFKMFDLSVEGVSLITTQRSEFSSVVSRKGLDYLISQLNAKTQELMNSLKSKG